LGEGTPLCVFCFIVTFPVKFRIHPSFNGHGFHVGSPRLPLPPPGLGPVVSRLIKASGCFDHKTGFFATLPLGAWFWTPVRVFVPFHTVTPPFYYLFGQSRQQPSRDLSTAHRSLNSSTVPELWAHAPRLLCPSHFFFFPFFAVEWFVTLFPRPAFNVCVFERFQVPPPRVCPSSKNTFSIGEKQQSRGPSVSLACGATLGTSSWLHHFRTLPSDFITHSFWFF